MRPDVEIVEVSPRDGLQNHPTLLPAADKAELVMRAIGAGVRRIEAVSFVNPRAVPQMADAEEVMARLRGGADLRGDGVRLIGLVLNARGLDRAMRADVDEVNFVVVASETFNQRNQGLSIRESLAQIEAGAAASREVGLAFGVTLGAAFGCPFEGEVEDARVMEIVSHLAHNGVAEIGLADTIGVADPCTVERRVAAVHALAPEAKVRCHFHNTRNTGLANVYAAWRSGADSLDASIGGIGGCPFAPAATGNVATEDTVYMLERMGVNTGLQLDGLIRTAEWLGGKLGETRLPAMLGRAGAFPKESAGRVFAQAGVSSPGLNSPGLNSPGLSFPGRSSLHVGDRVG